MLVLPKFLQLLASSQSKFFISARARQKIAVLGMLANARKDHSSPLYSLQIKKYKIDLPSTASPPPPLKKDINKI